MNLRIREAISDDYTEVCKLTVEVQKLHFKSRPGAYLDINFYEAMGMCTRNRRMEVKL